jgi:Fic family protein
LILKVDNFYSGHYSGHMNNTPNQAVLSLLGVLEGATGWVNPSQIEVALTSVGAGIPRRTLTRHLTALTAEGLLEQRGGGRSIEYRYSPISAWFKTPPTQRTPVPYQSERLSGYIPNKTSWLSPTQLRRLQEAQPPMDEVGSYPLAVAEKLVVDLSYASSALEGNTYNYLDTEVLIKYGQSASGKEADETTMIINHKNAVSYLVEIAQGSDVVSSRTIRELHSLLGQDLIELRELGALRSRAVIIGGSSYVPLAIPSKLKEEFDLLIEKAVAINNPFEQSLFWMVSIAYLQPFVDINKRTGRLACNVPLLRAGLAPLSFMSMDKASYVKGLLEFYELGSTSTISSAFEKAYVASAHRYEAHLSRDPAMAQIDRSYKQEIACIVREWVGVTVRGDLERWEDVVATSIGHISDQGLRQAIDLRAKQLLQGLNEANRIIYGIRPSDFDSFAKSLSARAVPQRAPRM